MPCMTVKTDIFLLAIVTSTSRFFRAAYFFLQDCDLGQIPSSTFRWLEVSCHNWHHASQSGPDVFLSYVALYGMALAFDKWTAIIFKISPNI